MADGGAEGWLGLLALLGAAGLSSATSLYANRQNQKLTKNTNLQMMNLADSAHQREVADLSAAGLNPILSAQGSGASTPSLQTPNFGNFGEAIGSSATSLGRMVQKLSTGQAQAEASSAKSIARYDKADAELREIEANREARRDMLEELRTESDAIEESARLDALTEGRDSLGSPVVRVSNSKHGSHGYNWYPTQAYRNLVQKYKNDIETGRYLGSREHAMYEDLRNGISSGADVISAGKTLKMMRKMKGR